MVNFYKIIGIIVFTVDPIDKLYNACNKHDDAENWILGKVFELQHLQVLANCLLKATFF